MLYNGKDLLDMDPDERAREGVFMAFQYPVEIPGVNNAYFLKAALNAKRKQQGLDELDAMDFMTLVKEKLKVLHMDEAMLQRSVNEGFSGGEKKRNEIFHMAVLEPTLAMLDETDSGLDIDALRVVSEGVNAMRSPDRAFIVVTHYQRLLNYIVPDFVHVLSDGRIVRSGGRELALELEEKGYGWLADRGGSAVRVDGGEHGPSCKAGASARVADASAAMRRRRDSRTSASRRRGRKSGASPTWRRSRRRSSRWRTGVVRAGGVAGRSVAFPARCGSSSSTASLRAGLSDLSAMPKGVRIAGACATARATARTASSSISARSSTSTRIRSRRSTPRFSTTACAIFVAGGRRRRDADSHRRGHRRRRQAGRWRIRAC